MRLANGLIALDFQAETGSLVQVTDLRSGLEYLSSAEEGRLFRLFAPDDQDWIDRCIDSHEAGRPELSLSGDTLTIRFQNLRAADENPSGVDAVVRITLPPGEDEALFQLELANGGLFPIDEVIFPWIGGWHGFQGERGKILCGTHWPVDPFKDLRRQEGWNLLNSMRKLQIGFPHLNIPMCDITNGKVGLSYNFYPSQPDLNFDLFIFDLNERYGNPSPSFGWVHRPFLKPGRNWQSGAVGVAPHSGDWHTSADKMRRWLSTWWQAPALPASLRGAIGFQNIYFRDFTGRTYRPLSAMPALARHGLEHGLEHLIVWDMPLLGMYLRPGSSAMFEDAPERIVELKAALKEVRAMGVSVSPLTNWRLTTQTHPFWKEHGEQWAIRSAYGMPAQETLPLRRNTSALINRFLDQGGVKLCQAHPEFQAWALENTRHVLDLGFNATFIDQPFSEDYCFSDRHGHTAPIAGHRGTLQWISRAAEIVHQCGADSYVIGEVPDIWNTQFFDLWWFWDWSWLRPEVFRYILPDSLQSWVIDAFDHEDQVGKAFAMGFLLNINVRSLEKTLLDAPEFAERVSQLAALRRKTAAFTTNGTFRDQTGLTVDTDAEVNAALYTAGDKTGIILGEGSRVKVGGGDVKLALSPEELGIQAPSEVILHSQDGSTRRLQPSHSNGDIILETHLDRWMCAVVEIA